MSPSEFHDTTHRKFLIEEVDEVVHLRGRVHVDNIIPNSEDPRQYFRGNSYARRCVVSDSPLRCSAHVARSAVRSYEERYLELEPDIKAFCCYIAPVRALPVDFYASHPPPSDVTAEEELRTAVQEHVDACVDILHVPDIRTQVYFPDKGLIQYDCGKLQQLDLLLRKLKREGHRCIIFTQMSSMLDIFESFLNYHGHTYLRLDGTTKAHCAPRSEPAPDVTALS